MIRIRNCITLTKSTTFRFLHHITTFARGMRAHEDWLWGTIKARTVLRRMFGGFTVIGRSGRSARRRNGSGVGYPFHHHGDRDSPGTGNWPGRGLSRAAQRRAERMPPSRTCPSVSMWSLETRIRTAAATSSARRWKPFPELALLPASQAAPRPFSCGDSTPTPT